MIEISNLRIEDMADNWSRAIADIKFKDIGSPFDEDSMWFATRKENKDMLSSENYDAFILVPVYLAMYYKQDLYIKGKVSKRLYKNIMTYIQTILCEFSDKLAKINISVEGFTDEKINRRGKLIGTGISCGVDSLSTLFDHFENEGDKDYRINSLFLFNCGTHGDYEDPNTFELYEKRYLLNKRVADELGLPIFQINSNLHAFTHKIGEQRLGYFAIWSCILAFEKVIKKYYVSSSYDYEQIKKYRKQAHDFDMAEFCESYLVPLIRTEQVELINDGSQHSRTEKTEDIANWDIAKKYLNVCVNSKDGSNCSKCSKCMRTLIPLEAMGKLTDFSDVFDLKVYRKYAFRFKCSFKANEYKEGFAKDIIDYCKTKNYAMPNIVTAKMYVFFRRCGSYIKKRLLN